MSKKFKINMEKLNRLIEQFQAESDKSDAVTQEYITKAIELLGTSALKSAIATDSLSHCIDLMLHKETIHTFYTDEEFFKMIEGLSNYEIVGDWQHFLTINCEYLFELPREMQEKFADSFSVGNSDAKECLLSLWSNHIETTGTDVVRKGAPGSTFNITICCHKDDLKYIMKTLRKIFTC